MTRNIISLLFACILLLAVFCVQPVTPATSTTASTTTGTTTVNTASTTKSAATSPLCSVLVLFAGVITASFLRS